MIRLQSHQLGSPPVCEAVYLPEGSRTNGDLDGSTSVDNLLASDKTVGTVHGNASDSVLTQVLSDLKNESATFGGNLTLTKLNFEGVKDRGEVVRVEVDVNDGTNDGLDRTSLEASGSGVGAGSVGWKSRVEESVKQSITSKTRLAGRENPNSYPHATSTSSRVQTTSNLLKKSVAKYSPALAGRVTLEEEAASLGTMFLAWLAAVLNKAALARAFFNCWPPRLERRIAERVTRVIILG